MDVLDQMRSRLRLQGAVLLFLCTAFVAALVMLDPHSDRAAIVMVMCAIGAIVGLWRLIRMPRWLRRPDEIDRFDRHVPGDRDAMQIVLVDGTAFTVKPPAGKREELAHALQQRCNATRLRARVVRG